MLIKTEALRNLALIGHTGTGKTSLNEQILFVGGVIPKAEKVETGRTVSDYTEEEIKRGISIHTSFSHLFWRDTKINILDTPGSADFVGETILAFRSTECALMLVGARSGVQVETVKLWRELNKKKLPRMIFINKLDKADTDFDQTLQELRDKFQMVFIPVTIPIGHDVQFKGVINLLDMKAYYYQEGAKEKIDEIPSDYLAIANQARKVLVEEAAEGDEELLDLYVEKGDLTDEQIKRGLREGLEKNQFVPVFCGSALLGSGILPLLDFTAFDSPSPFNVEEPCISGEKSRIINPNGNFSGLIFKTIYDQFAGKLSFIKVVTGKLGPESEAYNPRTAKKEKLGRLFLVEGKNLKEIDELSAGDIGVVAKVDSLQTNDTLCHHDDIIHYHPLELPQPVYSLAISAKNQKDEDKMTQILLRASEEDLTFQVRFNPQTKESVISAMGELQMSIILDRIRAQKIEFTTKLPRIPYKETITKSATAEYTHKKQTGGHGQYGKVLIEVSPLPRGDQFKFEEVLKGQNLSRSYLPAIEKGILEAMEEGFLAGNPIVDIKVTVIDGKEHPVDSSELSFKLAARGALRAALEQAKPIILEPIYKLSVYIEEKYLGDVLSDLSAKRARVLGQNPIGKDMVEIQALVPLSEIQQYALQLKSITSSTGAYDAVFDHYDPLGAKETQALIQDYQAHRAKGEHE
jgi:elongation factor G